MKSRECASATTFFWEDIVFPKKGVSRSRQAASMQHPIPASLPLQLIEMKVGNNIESTC
jgi:hypothetical protein